MVHGRPPNRISANKGWERLGGDALGANSRGISGIGQASYSPQTETPSRTLGSVSVIVGGPPSSTEVQPQDRGLLDALVANRLIARWQLLAMTLLQRPDDVEFN